MATKAAAPIHTIVLHHNADRHIDDAAVVWLAQTRPEAEARFPGISKAKIVFAGTGGEDYQGCCGDDFEKEGVLMFGVGGGQFDEHPGPNAQKKSECSCVLFARELDIENDPALKQILKFINAADKGESGHIMSIASMAKILHHVWPDEPIKVMNWQIVALEAKYREQTEFLSVTKKEYDQKAEIEETNGPRGKIKVVTIESENELINNYARSQGADVVIQQRPKNSKVLAGNIMVYTNKMSGLNIADAVATIRQEEQRAKGQLPANNHEKLRAAGKMEGVPEWYYLEEGQMLLNGSFSAPQTPATRLQLKTVKQIVLANLGRAQRKPIFRQGR